MLGLVYLNTMSCAFKGHWSHPNSLQGHCWNTGKPLSSIKLMVSYSKQDIMSWNTKLHASYNSCTILLNPIVLNWKQISFYMDLMCLCLDSWAGIFIFQQMYFSPVSTYCNSNDSKFAVIKKKSSLILKVSPLLLTISPKSHERFWMAPAKTHLSFSML